MAVSVFFRKLELGSQPFSQPIANIHRKCMLMCTCVWWSWEGWRICDILQFRIPCPPLITDEPSLQGSTDLMLTSAFDL